MGCGENGFRDVKAHAFFKVCVCGCGCGQACVCVTCARDSPYVLMLSVPHRVKAMDCGYAPESCFMRSSRRLATVRATSTAAMVGMDWGCIAS